MKTRFLSEETIALGEELQERREMLAEMVNADLADVSGTSAQWTARGMSRAREDPDGGKQ